MPERISKEIFEHLVDLAALELGPQEAEYIHRQLNNQLQAIHELEAIPLDESLSVSDSLEVTSHGVPFTTLNSQPPREDLWRAHPNPEEILAQAPQVEDGYIIVPDIPTTKLD
jgi:aspartyl-tRNA(Asn)/glutamyl-tRNA(Gln) amidotransferase subunit C